jgi:hypothetical protein
MFSLRFLVFCSLAPALFVARAHAQGAADLFKGQKITPKKSASNRPAQSQLARKSAFPVYATKGMTIPATDLTAARAKLNQNAAFSGTVVAVYAPKSNARVLLNFAAKYKTALVGLVDAKNFRQFPDLRQLKGKRVVVSGRVLAFKDEIEVELVSPNAIRIVK